MIVLTNENQCCGCAACVAVCPQHCIEMRVGSLGHLFPHIDTERCVSCGLCDKICPMNTKVERIPFEQKAYAAFSEDRDVRFRGSSGGMFEIFSKALLKHGFLIYGAAFTGRMKLKCVQADSMEALLPLLKSKYLQSDMHEKFNEIEHLLQSGRNVMFTSTPCQVSALKNYLRKPYPNLITVDFFCHGVPSQLFFDECLAYDEAKHGWKIDSYMFRVKKSNGSTPHYCSIGFTQKGKHYIKDYLYFDSTFYTLFQNYICLRESCYHCCYADSERVSDITIGDFHEVDRYVSGINRFDGVSTIIINSAVGEYLWNECIGMIRAYPVRLEQLIHDGVCFNGGTNRPKERDAFLELYDRFGIKGVAEKYADSKLYFKNRIYYAMPKCLRTFVKYKMGSN